VDVKTVFEQVWSSFLHGRDRAYWQKYFQDIDLHLGDSIHVGSVPDQWLDSDQPLKLDSVPGALAAKSLVKGVDTNVLRDQDLEEKFSLVSSISGTVSFRPIDGLPRLKPGMRKPFLLFVKDFLSGSDGIEHFMFPYLVHRVCCVDAYGDSTPEEESNLDEKWLGELLSRIQFVDTSVVASDVHSLRRAIIESPRILLDCLTIKDEMELLVGSGVFGNAVKNRVLNVMCTGVTSGLQCSGLPSNLCTSYVGVSAENIWYIPSLGCQSAIPVFGFPRDTIVFSTYAAPSVASDASSVEIPVVYGSYREITDDGAKQFLKSCIKRGCLPSFEYKSATLVDAICELTSQESDSNDDLNICDSYYHINEGLYDAIASQLTVEQMVGSKCVSLFDIAVQKHGYVLDEATFSAMSGTGINDFGDWAICRYTGVLKEQWQYSLVASLVATDFVPEYLIGIFLRRPDLTEEIRASLTNLTSERVGADFVTHWHQLPHS
jgi:hypothetical protein